jgi:hypothetical protein
LCALLQLGTHKQTTFCYAPGAWSAVRSNGKRARCRVYVSQCATLKNGIGTADGPAVSPEDVGLAEQWLGRLSDRDAAMLFASGSSSRKVV